MKWNKTEKVKQNDDGAEFYFVYFMSRHPNANIVDEVVEWLNV